MRNEGGRIEEGDARVVMLEGSLDLGTEGQGWVRAGSGLSSLEH